MPFIPAEKRGFLGVTGVKRRIVRSVVITSISKKEINDLPIKHYAGPIHVIDSDAKMMAAARSLGREKVLGFDPRRPGPLLRRANPIPRLSIQLAAADGVYIFQIKADQFS